MDFNNVLFVGNDINSINKGHYSWKKLLRELIRKFTNNKIEKAPNEKKPFPLLYEEIYQYALEHGNSKGKIEKYIAKNISKIQPNEIHKKIINSRYKNIITTNYDFTLERVDNRIPDGRKRKGDVLEYIYSIFRRYKNSSSEIWHIHGDSNYPNSIMLGLKEYGDYLEKIIRYIDEGPNYAHLKKPNMRWRLKSNNFNIYSWVDLFFSKNIHILGYSFDFVEYHLWWLIIARIRMMQNVRLGNRIFYYYPVELKSKIKHKLQVFKAYMVEPIAIQGYENNKKSKIEYYSKILDRISS